MVDTIKEGRFEDTNKMFVKPKKYDYRVTQKCKVVIKILDLFKNFCNNTYTDFKI